MKFVFMPISIIGGILAGLVGKKIFEQIWGLIDNGEPPDAKHREIDYPKLVRRVRRHRLASDYPLP